jgi:hypothetical protein
VQVVSATDSYGKFILEPRQRGFATTVGNAFQGAATTATFTFTATQL